MEKIIPLEKLSVPEDMGDLLEFIKSGLHSDGHVSLCLPQKEHLDLSNGSCRTWRRCN
jgi:hypothetical protein